MKDVICNVLKVSFVIIFFVLIFIIGIKKTTIGKKIEDNMRRKIYGEPISIDGYINNNFFNIDELGKRESTKEINSAIKYAEENSIQYIKLKKGIYLVDGQSTQYGVNETEEKKGIIMCSNIVFDLNGSVIIQKKNDKVGYAIFTVREVENVEIRNGTIIGDKEEHIYSGESTHEWGFGIDIRGGKNIVIKNMEISKCTGDGVFITNYFAKSLKSEEIRIIDTRIYECRRQGISIIDGNEVTIDGCEIFNIKGTSPQSGINLESWDSTQDIDNVYICNNKIYNCLNSIIIMGNSKNVNIQYNELYNKLTCDNIKEKLVVENNCIKNATMAFLVNEDGIKQGKKLQKIICANNEFLNSDLYMMNVENAIVEKNTIKDNKVMIFCSNLLFSENTVENNNENKQIAIGVWYDDIAQQQGNSEKIYTLYLGTNEILGYYNKKMYVGESDRLQVITDSNIIEEYKKNLDKE